jgi:hypothetical protein
VTFGQSRYRVGIDVVVVVLAALALSAGRPAGAVAPLA